MNLFLDTETYSPIDLKTKGLARYATQVEVMIATWALDEGPVHTEDLTHGTVSPALLTAAANCDRVLAHNAPFDRTVIDHSIPELGSALRGKFYCTMAQALRHGLPGGLDKLSTILKLPENHSKIDGHALVMLFCKPQKKLHEKQQQSNRK